MTRTSPHRQDAGSAVEDHPGEEFATLIDELELWAKVRVLTGATAFTLWPQASIGLGELRLSDGPTGVRGLKFSGGRVVALLPNATLLASAWSEDTALEVGQILAEEALAQQIHVVLGPTINLHRSLLGGRLFEAYSEDPLLTGKLAAAYVRGLQGLGVGACLKHLIANESETARTTMNSVVDEATLRELYLLPFEIAIAEAAPWSVMAAYNDVNGTPATEQQHVINEIVKGEWGYDGLVMSDWYATKSAAAAANGGLDLVMPGPTGPWGEALVAAVESGEVDEAVIDEHLRRLLRLAERVGALGELREYPADVPAPDSPTRREQLTRLAAQGMTVLTNKASALPINREQRVALIGRHGVDTVGMGGGSAQVNPPYQVSVADALVQLLGDRVSVTDGVEVRTRPSAAKPGFVVDPDTGESGVHWALFAGDGSLLQEAHNAAASTVVGFDDDFDQPVGRIRFRARLTQGGLVELGGFGVGQWTVEVGDRRIEFSVETAGTGFGEQMLAPPAATERMELDGSVVVEASVRLNALDSGVSPDDEFDGGSEGDLDPMAGAGIYGLIARAAARDQDEIIHEAAVAAGQADVAVVVVGLTEEQETESVDKQTLRLPGRQDELVAAVAGKAPRTVVVINAATPVIMPWLDAVDAVLWAGLPGQESGHAIAAALLGDLEPAGRLVTTFPVQDAATPAWSVTPQDGAVIYGEGPFIGYRGHHAGKAPAPVFWFGHGLGYAGWEYSSAELVDGSDEVSVRVAVTNTGVRPSREVVQLYFEPEESDQPIRLVGWQAVTAQPGETVRATVSGDRRLWRRWDADEDVWRPLSGAGDLLVARGLGDVRARLPARRTGQIPLSDGKDNDLAAP